MLEYVAHKLFGTCQTPKDNNRLSFLIPTLRNTKFISNAKRVVVPHPTHQTGDVRVVKFVIRHANRHLGVQITL